MRYQALTVLMTGLLLPSLAAAQAPAPEKLEPCPYTPEEIEEALGLKVLPGEAADMKFPDGRDVGCIYEVEGSSTTLAVRQVWSSPGGGSGKLGAVPKEAREEPIAGDPDGARWTIGGGTRGEPRVELRYTRGRVQTRLLIEGRVFREAEIQPKILRLKRVP
jgi:hypothetical protein